MQGWGKSVVHTHVHPHLKFTLCQYSGKEKRAERNPDTVQDAWVALRRRVHVQKYVILQNSVMWQTWKFCLNKSGVRLTLRKSVFVQYYVSVQNSVLWEPREADTVQNDSAQCQPGQKIILRIMMEYFENQLSR